MSANTSPTDVALGFRVKSGWAMAVLVTGSRTDPHVCARRRIELSDPAVPESHQPYHAGMGKLQTDEARIKRLRKLIGETTTHSFSRLIQEWKDEGRHVGAIGLVIGSDIDPDRITNPHIRAHALEGRLFRTCLEDAARSCDLPCSAIVERSLYKHAAAALQRSESDLKRRLTDLGRAFGGPWRAEEKTACLAAWLALGSTIVKPIPGPSSLS
jgi:hypothetical protein